jgi:hypothetical protein
LISGLLKTQTKRKTTHGTPRKRQAFTQNGGGQVETANPKFFKAFLCKFFIGNQFFC